MKKMSNYKSEFGLILVLCLFIAANASVGDRSKFFVNCIRGCLSQNCSDGEQFLLFSRSILTFELIPFQMDYRSNRIIPRNRNTLMSCCSGVVRMSAGNLSCNLVWEHRNIFFSFDFFSYSCMWRTTNAFVTRNWQVPQFFGKWPFIRFLGMQEPASVVFSLWNFLSHSWMIRQFRRDVRKDSPMFYAWHVFCAVCLRLFF